MSSDAPRTGHPDAARTEAGAPAARNLRGGVAVVREILHGRTVVGGCAEGEALVTRQAIPGWGGVNPVQGVITEIGHDLRGIPFKDRVLVCRGAKGSSGWSAMYHTTRLAGTAPKALIFNEMTTKIALGAVVMRIPSITDLDRDPLDIIETGDWVIVDADNGLVEIFKRGR